MNADEWIARMYSRGRMGKAIVGVTILIGAALGVALFVIAYTLAWACFG